MNVWRDLELDVNMDVSHNLLEGFLCWFVCLWEQVLPVKQMLVFREKSRADLDPGFG